MEMRVRRVLILGLCLLMFIPLISIGSVTFGEDYPYYGSKNSDVYHVPYCSSGSRILDKNKISFTSVEDAVNHGYHPCSICKPLGSASGAVLLPVSVPVTPPSVIPSAISVRVNSNTVPMTDSQPFVENGRTYVPVRAVLEAYGVDSITWEAPFVIVKKGEATLRIPVGLNYIEKNGIQCPIDSPAMIKDARTCLPIRAVIEALGGTVGWDAGAQAVLITKP